MTGRTFAHYRIAEALGSGGMGDVYAADDLTLGRRVAVKFLPEALASAPVALEHPAHELRIAGAHTVLYSRGSLPRHGTKRIAARDGIMAPRAAPPCR